MIEADEDRGRLRLPRGHDRGRPGRRSLKGRIPKRYRGVSFERPPVSDIARVAPEHVKLVRRYVTDIDKNLDQGQGLWLQGDVGTGKTTLAMLVSKAALDAGRTVAIYSLPRLLNLLRESMDSEAGLLDFLDRLAAVDLLHIDDLGAEYRTDGCSSSCTRSSTPATRPSARSSPPRT